MANLAALRQMVRDGLVVPPDDPMFTNARVNWLVNEALRRISSEADWVWLLAVSEFNWPNNDDYVQLPSDWARTRVVLVNRRPAHALTFNAQRSQYDGSYFWAVRNNRLYVEPAPHGVPIVHGYVRLENVLNGDADTPLLPDRCLPMLVAAALHLAKLTSNNVQEAKMWRDEYETLVAKAKRVEVQKPEIQVL